MLNKNIWIFKDIFLWFEFEVGVESNIYIVYNYVLLHKFVFVFAFYLWKWYFADVILIWNIHNDCGGVGIFSVQKNNV